MFLPGATAICRHFSESVSESVLLIDRQDQVFTPDCRVTHHFGDNEHFVQMSRFGLHTVEALGD